MKGLAVAILATLLGKILLLEKGLMLRNRRYQGSRSAPISGTFLMLE